VGSRMRARNDKTAQHPGCGEEVRSDVVFAAHAGQSEPSVRASVCRTTTWLFFMLQMLSASSLESARCRVLRAPAVTSPKFVVDILSLMRPHLQSGVLRALPAATRANRAWLSPPSPKTNIGHTSRFEADEAKRRVLARSVGWQFSADWLLHPSPSPPRALCLHYLFHTAFAWYIAGVAIATKAGFVPLSHPGSRPVLEWITAFAPQ
jgi:hypothetical protein